MKTKKTFSFPLVDTVMTGLVVGALALIGGLAIFAQNFPSVLA